MAGHGDDGDTGAHRPPEVVGEGTRFGAHQGRIRPRATRLRRATAKGVTVAKRINETRVLKKLSPTQPGAIKLARKYGDALLCVRYRNDASGTYRLTTVELVVDRAMIQTRSDRIVGVRIGYGEKSLQSVARASGATWDAKAKVWRMPHRIATRLGLLERVTDA